MYVFNDDNTCALCSFDVNQCDRHCGRECMVSMQLIAVCFSIAVLFYVANW